MKRIICLALLVSFTGCATTTRTNPDGSTTKSTAVDFSAIGQGIKLVLPPVVSIIGQEVKGSVLTTNQPAM